MAKGSLTKKNIPSLSTARNIDRSKFICLDLNESASLVTPQILSKLRKFDLYHISTYPQYSNLKKAISRYINIPVKNISISNGSDAAIEYIISSTFKKGDRVVMPSPTFFQYHRILGLVGAKTIEVPYVGKNVSRMSFPVTETLKAMTPSTKGLILCNPNNPTGTLIPKNDLKTLMDKANLLKIPVIVDEAYFEYTNQTVVMLVKNNSNLIVTRSFSKAFGLAGLRIGYFIADEKLINKHQDDKLPWEISHFSIFAAEVLLENLEEVRKQWSLLKIRREDLLSALRTKGISAYGSDANFILCKPKSPGLFIDKLYKHGILVATMDAFKKNADVVEGTVRIAVPGKSDLSKVKEVISKM